MPLFEYVCPNPKCNRKSERLQSFGDAQRPQFCDSCGYELDQLASRPAWFKTGKYGKGGQK